MTKQEFYDYVASFKKEVGQYTVEEMLEIGQKHKTLSLKDKNWQELVDSLGWQGSKDSFRMFVNSHTTKEDVLYEMSDLDRMYIAKTQVRDSYNALRRTLRSESRLEDIKQAIKDCVSQLNALPDVKYAPGYQLSEAFGTEAILMLSDLHIGVECDNFYNKYNVNVAKWRLSKLAADTIAYCKKNDVTRLNVINLGDLIHGLIHTNARLEQELDTVSQVMVAAELVAQFLNEVREAAPEIVYRSCSDNHSRVMANKNEQIELDNMGRLVDWFLQERLSNTSIKFANDNIDYSLGKFTLENGKKVMFAHGHNDSINRSFESFVGATKEFIDYGLLAHYHSSKMKDFQGFKIFVNGSIVGTEQYAISRRLFSSPCQTLLIFDDENLINITIDLASK